MFSSSYLFNLDAAPHLSPNPDCPVLHTTLHVYKCTYFKSLVTCVLFTLFNVLLGSNDSCEFQFVFLFGTVFTKLGRPDLHLAVIL